MVMPKARFVGLRGEGAGTEIRRQFYVACVVASVPTETEINTRGD